MNYCQLSKNKVKEKKCSQAASLFCLDILFDQNTENKWEFCVWCAAKSLVNFKYNSEIFLHSVKK